MSGTDLTTEEAFKSLNYFDLQTIKAGFGVNLAQVDEMPMEAMYAVVSILESRKEGGMNPTAVKRLSMQDITEYFATEEVDPASAAGKADTPAE